MSFLSIQLLKELSLPFQLTYSLSSFLFITFSTLNSFWFVFFFLRFFFAKHSNNFFAFKITNTTCLGHSVFIYFNHKNFFRTIWKIAFCKNVFIFWYSNNITNFKFRIFINNFFTRVNIFALFYINRFHFNCASTCIIIFINYTYYQYFFILK